LLWPILLFAQEPTTAEGYIRRGMQQFQAAHIKEAIGDFDRAIEVDPRQAPYLWQRGIALYYAGRFEDGSKQFELHQTVNGNDVENAAWRYLCMARAKGVETARAALLPIAQDDRIPMMQIYSMYKGAATPADVLAAAGHRADSLFYAHLYIGLYYEAAGKAKDARKQMQLAVDQHATHYMGDVARVHLKLTGK
jgi:lipoprotein NlpI